MWIDEDYAGRSTYPVTEVEPHFWVLPTLDLLSPARRLAALDRVELAEQSDLLERVLNEFGVRARVRDLFLATAATTFMIEVGYGTAFASLAGLADDVARHMGAARADIAPSEQPPLIAVRIWNPERGSFALADLIASMPFERAVGADGLAVVIGQDMLGEPRAIDLCQLPHLLIAGTTGSGKSTALHGLILSLLFAYTPDRCRLLLLDQGAELAPYGDVPHLLAPVLHTASQGLTALRWAAEHMEARFRLMAEAGVRSLEAYNVRVADLQLSPDPPSDLPAAADLSEVLLPLPRVVIVIESFADLMTAAAKDVESLVQRLAQKGRAAGIHLVASANRPSVDVVTGIIKSSIPSRISFRLMTARDSFTILDRSGAEELRGEGDLIFIRAGEEPVRMQAAMVEDHEIAAVASHWRAQSPPAYVDVLSERSPPAAADAGDNYRRAVELVVGSQNASTSWLQRQLAISYNAAAALIGRMERDGIVSKPDNIGRRSLLPRAADVMVANPPRSRSWIQRMFG